MSAALKVRASKALQYLRQVIASSHGVLDAITWHQYYVDGHTAKLVNFTDPAVLDGLDEVMGAVDEFMHKLNVSSPLWLGETSSAWGGGAHDLSNRYVAGFLWLDKLGVSAKHNYQVVIRQSFYHGCYALIGEDLLPYPDFWVSVLFKRLVGRRVLRLPRVDPAGRVRLYGHCALNAAVDMHTHSGGTSAPTNDGGSRTGTSAPTHDGGSRNGTAAAAPTGAIVLYGINMSDEPVTFALRGALAASPVAVYELAPKDGDLQARGILLNGKELLLTVAESLPPLRPAVRGPSESIGLGARGMAFWVFTAANVDVC